MSGPLRCRCGVSAEQPWTTRDAPYSPASVIGGALWVAAGFALLLAGYGLLGLALLGCTTLLVVLSLLVQLIKGHRRGCLVWRWLWFGIATQGLPLRVAYWLNF
ncbi:hypothetical protein EV138_1257 [Kribbella voronezhensis]|uniref:Uncharacterized protein n=1 Tax=Kribbella voronezhensis TaxID=2512212 RepID=A0A4R7T743_9ACTN|nr:hypothetical protein [Kribbella voronezhensis]TDU87730.1 hypothetical protein EV138_1257 [Kribbella voronezhensis]